MKNRLEVKNLHAEVDGKEILKGINLKIETGEIHAIMGPNGSGKSTLTHVITGHPRYKVSKGDILFNGESILNLEPEERAKLGIFQAFQYPLAIPGVKTLDFLRTAVNNIRKARGEDIVSYPLFVSEFKATLQKLGLDSQFMYRYLNDGFSGGEKKRFEIVQMLLLKPKMVILDEVDSGLDIDSVRAVAKTVNELVDRVGLLIITHYKRILDYITPDYVHVMINGRIVKSGGQELAQTLEKKGYTWLSRSIPAK